MTTRKKIFLSFLIIIILLLSGVLTYVMSRKPEVTEKPAVDQRVLVQALQVYSDTYTPTIKVLGKVEASDHIQLMAEVTGRVVKVNSNFVPGGLIKKGEVILAIDPTDYQIALREAKANLVKAESAYKQAIGRAGQAKEELKVYEKSTGKKLKNSYLALRQPELEQARSNVEQAKSAVQKAEINLERTTVKALFNTIVTDKTVSYGSFISAGANLATLINTDSYWIKASLPLKEMAFIDFANNPKVIVHPSSQPGEREASYFKLLNFLDDSARFMGILLVLKDPLLLSEPGSNAPQIFLDDYVHLSIIGKPLSDVFRLPLYTLKNNNIVWRIKDEKLTLFKVELVYQDNEYAYVRGLVEGDLIVTSDLSLAVNNMPVKIKTISK